MSAVEQLALLMQERGRRRVYVAEQVIDLSKLDVSNIIYVLQLPDSSTAAGGRGGGLGERRIVRVHHYRCGGGTCEKVSEIEDEAKLDSLELPYHATAMAAILPDGKEILVSGVVDPEFVSSYGRLLG